MGYIIFEGGVHMEWHWQGQSFGVGYMDINWSVHRITIPAPFPKPIPEPIPKPFLKLIPKPFPKPTPEPFPKPFSNVMEISC